jgi:hypothetical protein
MWPEPLTASAEAVDTHTVAVTTLDAAGVPVAAVLCEHNAAAGFGSFGEMRILDDRGGPRQRRRALVLLVREALRYANALGITRVHTEAPERLAPFASKLAGIPGDRLQGRRVYVGDLHAVRTAALLVSGDDGSLRDLTPIEEEEIDGAIDVRR